MSRGALWPLALVGLLVAGAGANIAFMVIATGDPTFAVEPDYYKKAVNWDRTMAQQARNASLGWTVSARVERGDGRVARLVTRVTDAAGVPISGAEVSADAFPSARAGHVVPLALAPVGLGEYAAPLPIERPGLWEIRLRVVRAGDAFTRTIGVDVPGPSS